MIESTDDCQYTLDGTDTDGTTWYQCTEHDALAPSPDAACAGWLNADRGPGGNTHYAVITFSGDFDEDHPDEELRGTGPSLTFLAAGQEDFCWQAAAGWTLKHPLQRHQEIEVLARHPSVVRLPPGA